MFLDNRAQALGQTPLRPAFERAVSVARHAGRGAGPTRFLPAPGHRRSPAGQRVARNASSTRWPASPTCRPVRSGRALAHLRAGASADTSLVFVSAPPAPGELTSLIRAGAGFGPKLAVLIHPADPDDPAARRAAPAGGPGHPGGPDAHQGRLGPIVLTPVDEAEGTMARTQGTNARTQRLTALLATALLATATAFAIGRVFVDHASTYRMAVAGLLSAAIAVALERREPRAGDPGAARPR